MSAFSVSPEYSFDSHSLAAVKVLQRLEKSVDVVLWRVRRCVASAGKDKIGETAHLLQQDLCCSQNSQEDRGLVTGNCIFFMLQNHFRFIMLFLLRKTEKEKHLNFMLLHI